MPTAIKTELVLLDACRDNPFAKRPQRHRRGATPGIAVGGDLGDLAALRDLVDRMPELIRRRLAPLDLPGGVPGAERLASAGPKGIYVANRQSR